MKRNAIKAISTTAVLSLLLSPALPVTSAKAAAGEVTKLSGADCYETAATVATQNWTSTDNVILASGEGYADAISSAVLAKQLKAPVLLTEAGSLNSNAKSALDKLKPKNIYIIGGTASICQKTRDDLKGQGYNLIELSGKNRYETNLAVAKQLVKLGVSADNIMMVGGEGFPDALSAAPVAAAKGEILLLGVNSAQVMSPIVDFIKSDNSKVTVIGTQTLINDDTYKSIGAVNRISGGADRFATNLNILNQFDSDLKSDKIYIANATGDKYADALIAASVAGISDAPLVLIDGQDDTGTANAMNYIKSKASSSTDLNVISENGVVSDSTISNIKNAAQGIVNESDTVNSVTTLGLNQIKIIFNTKVDKDSAERTANYEIDGGYLGSEAQTEASASLQDDGRTVIITFRNPFKQGKNVSFKVKNNVLSDGSSSAITEYEKEVTFQETGAPSIESVTPIGGNKLEVRFSEAIRMDEDNLTSMKINKKSITNYGFNKSYTKIANECGDWASGVDIYFNSPLPIGDNTFSMPDGTSESKFDNAANIPIQNQSKNFEVESVSGTPQVESVTSNNAGVIYIKFDRAMDTQTALESTNYKINGSTVDVDDSYVTFDSGSGDSIVKIKNIGSMLNQGTNTILVNDNVQDTFGNTLSQTSKSLYYGSDSNKPTVESANILDAETIRVKFNKDVIRSSATNTGNYTIVDSDGNDISYKLKNINTITVDGNNNRTFDLKFDDNSLNGSAYTFTVKNIIDTEAKANLMDTYTKTLSGTDDEDIKIEEVVKRADDDQAVAVFFNKTMNEDSISDKSNYLFRDGTGKVKSLPGGATITPSSDDKSVTIEFPSDYNIGSGSTARDVLQIGVQKVVDKNGNSLGLGYIGDISASSNDGPAIISGTADMSFSSDDIIVKVSLSSSIDTLDMNDFRVDGCKPDSATTSGNTVILIYKSGIKNGEKIDDIKNCGESTDLSVVNTGSVDAAGRTIRTGSTKVYIPPVTKSDNFEAISASNADTIDVAFNQDIDTAIQNRYGDDFIFTDMTTGKTLVPNAISVDDKTVVYRFSASSFNKGDVIKVAANRDSSSISIRSEKHDNAAYTMYSPSSDDLDGYNITAK
ncbi:cell wall-binding repeat-containing protein [Clostridium coskatii]|uniref:N-acetylmuramoyl-L-alanine amidase LytC n=1 Tax=Clostridium coskatii TaxID=1705578 RepID=A0A170NNP0_9CLOT|nr:cell wall-binding repeat-containing protein [Clostridium coskatii]OAA94173.1 N-acetylmuramoyl-L-alanine amidase LytC precursor [Clostridium coskatii]OBR95557.1 N-acetylmuramoyl-L-alanine amidase LytC precursor [Clostridium coskatii]